MVGRLVEQQGVGAHQQDARQRHAHLPAARERADVAVLHRLREAEAGQDLARARLERVAAELVEAGLHVAEALDQPVELVGARRVGQRVLERAQLGGHLGHRAGAGHGLGDHAAPRHLADVLAEVADGHAAVDRHLAVVGRLLPHDQAENRGLAGAVGADQPHLLAAVDGGGRVDEEDVRAVLLADGIEADHACFWARIARKVVLSGPKEGDAVTNESILISEVIPATPQRIFSAWMDSAEHSAFTGDEAIVVPEVGGEHQSAGGYIKGRTLELNEGSRIVQSWRTTEFPPESPDSRVEITLEPTLGGTLVTLLHTDIPVGQGDRYRQGWNEYYLSRLKTYFADSEPTMETKAPPARSRWRTATWSRRSSSWIRRRTTRRRRGS